MIYNYVNGFRGFSAKMTADQAALLAKRSDVVKVFKSEMRRVHTTRTWEFLGLPQDSEMGGIPHSAAHHNLVLGILDTGIWPESESFSDHNMPPIPARWKGRCVNGENFTAQMCNRKVIGAKYFLKGMEEQIGPLVPYKNGGSDVLSARDSVGHGSHTASTAAGRLVKNVTFQGLANGVARGGAPRARIAAYKVCWSPGCFDADILAAFDEAIKDGVDVLTLSLGPDTPQNDYFMDAISIGSFHAVRAGITVIGSVGNNGPSSSAATNVAPWLLTVGSTSIDRDFSSSILLGNNVTLKGESLSVKRLERGGVELIYAADARASIFNPEQARYCLNNSLDPSKVGGRIVVCRHPQDVSESKLAKSRVVKAAGGVGMILISELDKAMGVNFVIPGAIVGNKVGSRILSYMNSTRKARATITPAVTRLHIRPSPQVSVFSSRGPNSISPNILKPDVVAPGLNILAAWSPMGGSMGLNYNIVSGTSMSCPHVAGIALLLKASHPSWTPAAIKSALVTTASMRSNEGKDIIATPSGKIANAFDLGGGQVQPRKAQNPGLIYNSDIDDVVAFLCNSGYDTSMLRLVTGENSSNCPMDDASLSTSKELNYPAITLPTILTNQTIRRTLTNVGPSVSVYKSILRAPIGVNAYVVPNTLTFSSYGESLSYTIHFVVYKPMNGYVFGSLTWTDGRHKVRTPLVVNTV